jgi:hypothetical protein
MLSSILICPFLVEKNQRNITKFVMILTFKNPFIIFLIIFFMEANLNKGFRLFSVILLLMYLFGCASKSSIQREPLHAGKERRFQSDFSKTLEAAHEAMIASGLQVESNTKIDENTYMLIGKKGGSLWSWGELVRVTVIKEDAQTTIVRVVTKRRVSANITAKGDYSEAIFSNIELKLR